jgi:hypothetical protein
MIRICDPLYRPIDQDIATLNQAVREDVLKLPRSLSPTERRRISERIAMEATCALLSPLVQRHAVVDANITRRNNPGYDLAIDGRVRLQVKGGTFVESIGWTHSPDSSAPDLNYDVLIFVDVGVVLESKFGRLIPHNIPTKRYVDFYVIPGTLVRRWVEFPRRVNGKGVQIYSYKRGLLESSKEHRCQTVELLDYRSRFDILDDWISTLS